jgi:hypothetical protein
MKRTLLAGLSVLTLSALVSPAANAIPQIEQNLSKQSIETRSSASILLAFPQGSHCNYAQSKRVTQ